jgi:hypothetical protein
MNEIESYTIWVCVCCMMMSANGECCDSDEHGGDGCEPLSALGEYDNVCSGMDTSEHAEDCLFRTMGRGITGNAPDDYECECETNTFSWSQCEGCGSYLGGARYAMTVFPDERRPQ